MLAVLNIIDKCFYFETISPVLAQINGFLGEEVFDWEKNNATLSSATLGVGPPLEHLNYHKKTIYDKHSRHSGH